MENVLMNDDAVVEGVITEQPNENDMRVEDSDSKEAAPEPVRYQTE